MPSHLSLSALVTSERLPGFSAVAVFGSNPDIGTAFEDVWPNGGDYPFQTSASIMEVVSSSASDAAAGIGAQSVFVEGLDASGLELKETVVTNGTTPVATVGSYLAVNRSISGDAGTNGTNVGDIDVQVSGGGDILATIPADKGHSRQAGYTIPSDREDVVLSVWASCSCANNALVNVELLARQDPTKSWAAISLLLLETVNAPNWRHTPEVDDIRLDAGSQVRIRAVSTKINTCVNAGFELLEEEFRT